MKAFGFLLLLFTPALLFGQKYHFEKLGLKDDLSQISALSLHQDQLYRYGYICYGAVLLLAALLYRQYRSAARLHVQLRLEKKKNKEIKRTHKRRLSYLADVTHEFITPLTIITGTIEALLESARLPASVHPRLTLAHKNALRLKNLSRELLDFRKPEQGHFNIKVADKDFIPFLREIFEDFSQEAALRNISYTFVSQVAHCTLWFDPSQMDKVFFNLLANAFRFVADQTGKIEVKVLEHPDSLEVLIRDNGPGMPRDQAAKVFDRFYQIGDVAGIPSGQGAGMGLALSKEIVQQHLGTIALQSEENPGVTFAVKIRKGNAHFAPGLMGSQDAAPHPITSIIRNRHLRHQSFRTGPGTEPAPGAHSKLNEDFLQKARQYVLFNITDTELDVNTFAKEMALSRTRLYEKLKAVTGQTPNEFIQTIRLKQAAEMILRDGELNISQIAFEVGFSSSRYFSQCFKTHFGISPSKYGKVRETDTA